LPAAIHIYITTQPHYGTIHKCHVLKGKSTVADVRQEEDEIMTSGKNDKIQHYLFMAVLYEEYEQRSYLYIRRIQPRGEDSILHNRDRRYCACCRKKIRHIKINGS
jgi:hypothetical protein